MPLGVIFGAGSVGRGFIGQLFSESGLDVVFIDVVKEIIDGINRENSYPHITVSSQGSVESRIEHVRAVSSQDLEQVTKLVAEADIIATSVGAAILPRIADPIAQGLRLRMSLGLPPANILLCENLHHAADFMRKELHGRLSDIDNQVLYQQIGLLETSIGRMIPVPSDEIRQLHPAAVCVEPYKFLPFDAAAVRGAIPEIKGLVGDKSVPFQFYSDRKLYVHNMGHCFCAYLGQLFSDTLISEAAGRPEILMLVRAAMLESAVALSIRYRQPLPGLIDHVDDLLRRFGNTALKDTIERVGRDPERKMAAEDRFIGALRMTADVGTPRRYLSLAAASGLSQLARLKGWSRDESEAYLLKAVHVKPDDSKLILQLTEVLEGHFDFRAVLDILDSDLSQKAIV